MYYSKFDELGNQTESMLATEDPGDGWYQVGDDVVGKRFRLVDGEAVEMTSEEIESENDALLLSGVKQRVRDQRAKLLVDSDWTVNPQVPLSEEKTTAWAAYRQALRDFPSTITLEQVKAGTDLSWPVPPS
jgi:hypothetical protein